MVKYHYVPVYALLILLDGWVKVRRGGHLHICMTAVLAPPEAGWAWWPQKWRSQCHAEVTVSKSIIHIGGWNVMKCRIEVFGGGVDVQTMFTSQLFLLCLWTVPIDCILQSTDSSMYSAWAWSRQYENMVSNGNVRMQLPISINTL